MLVEIAEPVEEEAYPVEDGDVLEPSQETISQTREDSQPVHWNVSMPNPSFGINACAEEWEYDEDDDEDEAALDSGTASARSRKHGPGILAKRGNKTAIQLDLSVGREATGDIRVPLYITYTYTAEEPLVPRLIDKTDKRKVTNDGLKAQASAQESMTSAAPPGEDRPDIDKTPTNLKSFSFWTSVPLGRVVPRAAGSTLNVEHSEARRVSSSSNLH